MYVDSGMEALTKADAGEPHGWFPFYKKCGPVPGKSSLDAEMGGCGMLIDTLQQWMEKCAR